MRAYSLVVVGVLSLSSASLAQTTPAAKPTITVGDFELSPELEIRTRGEYRRNPVDMGKNPPIYIEDPWAIMERARIGLGADRGPLRAKVTLQDARVWGSTPPTATGSMASDAFASTGVYEAFIEIHTTDSPTAKPSTDTKASSSSSDSSRNLTPQYIRVGRQAIVWDGGRLLGNADFSPVARTLDAVRGHVGWKSLDFEAFASILDEPHPIGIGFGDPSQSTGYTGGSQLYGALASLTLDPLFRAQLYGLLRPKPSAPSGSTFVAPPIPPTAFSQARMGDDWTMALGISGDSKGWKYGVTGALQFGNAPTLNGAGTVDRLAYAAVGDASRTFDGVVLTPTIKIGAGYASGGSTKSASGVVTQYNQFDPLYPDVQVNHGLLGAFAWSNIIDLHGAVSVVPMADFRVTAEYRYARMADKTGDWLDTYLLAANNPAVAASSEELGHEVDLILSYRPWPALNVAAGYSLLILGSGARSMMAAEQRGTIGAGNVLVPPDTSHYAFVQLTLSVPAR